jgi:hypothetical protein
MARRVFQLRRRFKVDTQQMRLRTIRQLEELFYMASSFARGEQRWERVGGKGEPMEMKQRQMWARVAAYIAEIVTTVTAKYDEREIDKELDELERLVNEASAKHEVSANQEERREEQKSAQPAEGQG